MTALPRALTWAYLLPQNTGYRGEGLPAELGDLLDTHRERGADALVVWERSARDLPSLDRFSSVIAMNTSWLKPDELRAMGFQFVHRYAVLPRWDSARWFIPLGTAAVSSAAFCLYQPSRATARVIYRLLRMVVQSGFPRWYQDELIIARREPSPLDQAVQDALPGQEVQLALSSGSFDPDSRRKPTIAALDVRGRVLAFGKIGPSPTAADSVRHEATVLPLLARRLGTAWRGPTLLGAGEVDGMFMAFQTPVQGRFPGLEINQAHRSFLATLSQGPIRPVMVSKLVKDLLARTSAAPEVRSMFGAALRTLDSVQLPETIVHGDFAPWNIRRYRGQVAAFDWEGAEFDGLPLLDKIHHCVITGYLVRRWTVPQALRRIDRIVSTRPYGLTTNQGRALVIIALLRFCLRSGPEHDPALMRWYEELLDVLTAHLVGAEQ